MSVFNTEHKRKSATITTVIMILLLVLMIFFGMNYLDPPEESGIAVNFGNTDVGSGNSMATELPKPQTSPAETEEKQTETNTEETAAEEVVTQNNEEAIAIEAKKKIADEAKKAKAEADRIVKEKQLAEEKAQKERDKKKKELDDMMNGVNNSDGKENEGEGPENEGGNKGQLDGDPYAKTYFGKPGSGTGGQGGSGLGNRTRLQTAKEIPDCQFAGRVVIDITVNRQGQVIAAERGAGTLAAEQCLIDAALKAAKKFKWNADANAPERQFGVIEFNFSLGGK